MVCSAAMIVISGFSDFEVAVFQQIASQLEIDDSFRFFDAGEEADAGFITDQCTSFSGKPPRIIVVNLDRPVQTWKSLIAEFKRHATWRVVPVLGFGLLEDRAHVEDFYALGGASCVQKPQTPERFLQILNAGIMYWLDVASFPGDYSTAT